MALYDLKKEIHSPCLGTPGLLCPSVFSALTFVTLLLLPGPRDSSFFALLHPVFFLWQVLTLILLSTCPSPAHFTQYYVIWATQNLVKSILARWFFLFYYLFLKLLFIYLWLHWVFVAKPGLSLASEGYTPVAARGFLIVVASFVSEHGL